ncbi:RidA family protein [Methylobacterium sp. 37f]|uniref:RidA family protein n=1 Tax=Methylobacterium sp. 37f TaxID=2817058 RepID=UPI001FFDBEC9|nr:RidA family protein [Methylobacterium sp. 37f]MCK2056736.1 RidA family protein [Methylobacterium sp. 37f]
MLRPINPPGPSIPGISQAMLLSEGRLLILSGHVPFDDTGTIVAGDRATQLDQVFRNMQATLHAAGADFSAVARLTIYVRDYDPAELPAIRAVRDRWINAACPPASALIGVAALAFPDMLVEGGCDGVPAAVVQPTRSRPGGGAGGTRAPSGAGRA